MLNIRRAEDRGQADHGWLKSAHTFSFANYWDPKYMGFETLRVINDDRVIAGAGFGTHPHRDMEIISYVLDGALEHKDSMGNGSIIKAGDVQRMSAGTGVTHSEFNHSKKDPVHFLQIWFLPEKKGLQPGYEQIHFDADSKRNRLKLVASRKGRDGSVSLNQDMDMYASLLDEGASLEHRLDPTRRQWLHVARGTVSLGKHKLKAGDGVSMVNETTIELHSAKEAEIILFDMAPAA